MVDTLDQIVCEDTKKRSHFLGIHFQRQQTSSKYKLRKSNTTARTSCTLNNLPTESLVHKQFNRIIDGIKQSSSSTEVVTRVSPIIRGWSNDISVSSSRTAEEVGKWNTRLYLLVKNWGKSHLGIIRRTVELWTTVGEKDWRFYGVDKYKRRPILPMYDILTPFIQE